MTRPEGDAAPPQYPASPGYPQYPQYPGDPGYPQYPPAGMPGGWSPAPPPGEEQQYRRVGVVPWTYAQTWRGTLLTVVPWLVAMLLLQLASGTPGSTATAQPSTTRTAEVIVALLTFILSAIIEGAFLIAPLVYSLGHRPAGVSPRDGARALGFRSTDLLAALGWVAGGFLFMLFVTYMYGIFVEAFHLGLKTNGQLLLDQARNHPLPVLASLLAAVLIAPFCEEIFFRGYLFAGLLRGMSGWAAVLVSALIFAIVHDIGSAIPIFILGLVLAIVRWRTGSIWPTIALHITFNTFTAVVTVLIMAGVIPAA